MASSATNDFQKGDNADIHHIEIKTGTVNNEKDNDINFCNIETGLTSETKKERVPKRLIYCSNGVIPVYDTEDEETDDDEQELKPQINTADMDILPWIWYRTVTASYCVLAAVDYLGEKFAYMFGITSPKYQFAVDEYNRMMEEEEEERKFEEREEAARRAFQAEALSMVEGGGINIDDIKLNTKPEKEQDDTSEENTEKF